MNRHYWFRRKGLPTGYEWRYDRARGEWIIINVARETETGYPIVARHKDGNECLRIFNEFTERG